MTLSNAGTPTTYRQVFSEPTFRLLFSANLASVIAGTLRTVALSLLVYEITGSPFLTALTYGITFVPQAVAGVLTGALADRVRPRKLIAVGYLFECAVGAVVALTAMPIAASLALLVVLGALTPAFRGANGKVIAQALHGDAYVLGRSLASLAVSGGQLVGLAAGGLVVAWIGAPRAILIGAALHLVAAVAVRVGLPDLPAADRVAGSVMSQSWAGTRLLLSDNTLRPLFIAQWLPPAFVAGVESLVLPYALIRGFPVGTAGALLACLPVGMIVGDVAIGRFVRPDIRVRLVLPLMGVIGLALVPFAFNPPIAVCGMLLAVAGVGNAYMLGVQGRFRDAAPTAMLGQSFALLGTGLMVLQGLGPMLFGMIAEQVAFGLTVAVAGGATLVVAVAMRSSWRSGSAPNPPSSQASLPVV